MDDLWGFQMAVFTWHGCHDTKPRSDVDITPHHNISKALLLLLVRSHPPFVLLNRRYWFEVYTRTPTLLNSYDFALIISMAFLFPDLRYFDVKVCFYL